MNKIPVTRVVLTFSTPLGFQAKSNSLRGAIASHFPEEPLLHQHLSDGFLYRYPLVQYRWANGKGVLIGFWEGAKLLARLPLMEKELRIETQTVTVIDAEMKFAFEEITASTKLEKYEFISPWLPLNQENFHKFGAMEPHERLKELERIAVGNILATMKGLKYEFPARLFCAFQEKRQVQCKYKNRVFLGFFGELSVNAMLPNDLSIGKAVSHGFGWLKCVEDPM